MDTKRIRKGSEERAMRRKKGERSVKDKGPYRYFCFPTSSPARVTATRGAYGELVAESRIVTVLF